MHIMKLQLVATKDLSAWYVPSIGIRYSAAEMFEFHLPTTQ